MSVGAPLLRLRSDEQLVALFRGGHDEAFRAIYDRYHQRLFAYTRQMLLGSRQDAEDALQDVFIRAYAALRANDRDLALRAWLYRIAHNRCIDELRRPPVPAPELIELVRAPVHDPIAEAERRESLQRLVSDVRRLPKQQRSALLMRELGGMTYTELAGALAVSVPAVKSLLVRARVSLAAAAEARDTACSEIRSELVAAHDRRMRPNAIARRHLRDCAGCREFRAEVRGVSRGLAALAPTLGPVGLLWNSLGLGGGGGAAAGGGAAMAGGGAFAASGLIGTGITHVATLIAAAVVTTGGAIELQQTLSGPVKHGAHHQTLSVSGPRAVTGRAAAPGAPAAAPGSAPAAEPTPAGSAASPAVLADAARGISPVSTTPRASSSRTNVAPLAIDGAAASAAAAAATAVAALPVAPPASGQPTDSGSSATSSASGSSAPATSSDSTAAPSPPAGTGKTGTDTGTPSTSGSTGSATGSATSSPSAGSQPSSGGTAPTGTSASSGASAGTGATATSPH